MSKHLVISDERHKQLSDLAEQKGIGIAEAFGLVMRAAIDAGLLDGLVDGFKIHAQQGAVWFELAETNDKRASMMAMAIGFSGLRPTMTPAEAYAFADRIEALCDGARELPPMPMEFHRVARVGQGVRFTLFVGTERTVSKDIARDIARLVRRAADNANKA